jgi:hypothetical protein
MRNIPLGWSITGAVIGMMGFVFNLITLGAIINKVYVGRGWLTLAAVLCPSSFIPLRNVGGIFALNCIFYAVLFGGLRFVWIKLRRSRENSN